MFTRQHHYVFNPIPSFWPHLMSLLQIVFSYSQCVFNYISQLFNETNIQTFLNNEYWAVVQEGVYPNVIIEGLVLGYFHHILSLRTINMKRLVRLINRSFRYTVGLVSDETRTSILCSLYNCNYNRNDV